jgi:RHS repeat-associated protein
MRREAQTLLVLFVLARPVPLAATERVYFFHNDHLGTPQSMSDEAGRKVWEAEYDSFGKATVNEDADGDGQIVVNNLRFPGQYFDAETGLHYNYHRVYDPETGRYLQPDPIGLAGGLNLYPYVDGDPVSRIDPDGLIWQYFPQYWPRIQPAAERLGGQLLSAAIGLIAGIGIGEAVKDKCEQPCPPCTPYRKGTIGYQGPEVHTRGMDAGVSHYHLFEVEQIPSTCKCIWKERTTQIAGDHHYLNQPNLGFSVDLNGSGRPPNYPH